jgi:hypothetical protein
MDPLHLARFEASSPTQRDTHLRLTSCDRSRLVRPVILTRAPRVPVLTVIKSQQRSLTSSIAVYPQACIQLVRAMIAARPSKLGLVTSCDRGWTRACLSV